MIFNSFVFWIFFAVVLLAYYLVFQHKAKAQNMWLLLASYFFYGYANWKMIPLLVIVTLVFYQLGIWIEKDNESKPQRASRLTTLGVILGVGVLVYFKYLGFLVQEIAALLNAVGFQVRMPILKIVLPVGISFFTFKLISYVLEVYRGRIPAVTLFRLGPMSLFSPPFFPVLSTDPENSSRSWSSPGALITTVLPKECDGLYGAYS